MLSIKSVSEPLEVFYANLKKLSVEFYSSLKTEKESLQLHAETDLLQFLGDDIGFIQEGYFKLKHENKCVRLYSESDFIDPQNNFDNFSLASEFASNIVKIDRQTLLEEIYGDNNKLDQWLKLQGMENKLILALCSTSLPEEIEAKFEVRQFEEGDTIIKEGDAPADVFEMISGQAQISLGNRPIGQIEQGEIFGVIGFLTEGTRVGTVVATKNCFVRTVRNGDFIQLLESNPQLGMVVVRALSNRIVQIKQAFVDSAG